MPMQQLFEVLAAASYMDISPLLDLVCAQIACVIKDEPDEVLRKHFVVTSELTEEEEDYAAKQNEWTFETEARAMFSGSSS